MLKHCMHVGQVQGVRERPRHCSKAVASSSDNGELSDASRKDWLAAAQAPRYAPPATCRNAQRG